MEEENQKPLTEKEIADIKALVERLTTKKTAKEKLLNLFKILYPLFVCYPCSFISLFMIVEIYKFPDNFWIWDMSNNLSLILKIGMIISYVLFYQWLFMFPYYIGMFLLKDWNKPVNEFKRTKLKYLCSWIGISIFYFHSSIVAFFKETKYISDTYIWIYVFFTALIIGIIVMKDKQKPNSKDI